LLGVEHAGGRREADGRHEATLCIVHRRRHATEFGLELGALDRHTAPAHRGELVRQRPARRDRGAGERAKSTVEIAPARGVGQEREHDLEHREVLLAEAREQVVRGRRDGLLPSR
jgi:hypothetical protein